jgi:flagellar basal-body rod modification protein FlgD
MTTISPISAPTSSGQIGGFADMSSEDFMKIIFTELTNQDPLAPSDSAALLQQLNSIRSIEADLKMMTMLQSLVHENQLAASGNLLGKFIGGLTQDNFRVAGWVVAVIREGDSINLELDNGWIVPMSGVETIIDPSLFADDAPAPSGPVDDGDNDDGGSDGGNDGGNDDGGEDDEEQGV